jgi:hypothetical protein
LKSKRAELLEHIASELELAFLATIRRGIATRVS